MNFIKDLILKNSAIAGGTVFFIGVIFYNFFNWVFHLLMGRALGPSSYGELAAILSFFLILSVPAAPFQTVIARFSSILKTQGKFGEIKKIFVKCNLISLFIWLFVAGALFLSADFLKQFLNLSSKTIIWQLIWLFLAIELIGIVKGILLGLERFFQLSVGVILEGLLKLAGALFFVYLGFKVEGALIGILASLIISYFFYIYFLKDVLKSKDYDGDGVNNREILKSSVWTFIAFLLLNVLLNQDIILVKHFFNGQQAGIYSALSNSGRILFLAASILAGVLLPLVSSRKEKNENYFKPFYIILGVTLAIAAFFLALFLFFPKLIIYLFFGRQYLEASGYLFYYGLIMAFYSLIFLFSYFLIALNKFKFLYILAAGSVLEYSLINFRHGDFSELMSMFLVSLVLTSGGILFLIYSERKKGL